MCVVEWSVLHRDGQTFVTVGKRTYPFEDVVIKDGHVYLRGTKPQEGDRALTGPDKVFQDRVLWGTLSLFLLAYCIRGFVFGAWD